MRDLHNNITVIRSVMAQRATGTTDITGADVDRQGFRSVEHIVTIGATGDTLSGSLKFDFILEHADPNTAGTGPDTYSAVDNNEHVLGGSVTGSGIFATVDANTEDETIYRIGYIGGKRYTRVKVDLTGTHTNGTVLAVVSLLGHPSLAPTE